LPGQKLSVRVQGLVRERAKGLCEYCHTSERWQYVRFTIDHIVPSSMGGSEDIRNLALCCFHCNRRKSAKVTGIDPNTLHEVFLFNPRTDDWSEHSTWSKDGKYILPLTAEGRSTASLLEFNRSRIIEIREADVVVQRHPPEDDPVEGRQ
jgi:hypothetical protein